MDTLLKQVAAAHRRLVFEQFVRRLVVCLTATLGVAAVAVAAPKAWPLPTLPPWWGAAWLAGGATLGVLAAGAWTLARRRSHLDAAIEVDKRFNLRERVASSMSLTDEDRESEAGRAVVADAVRAVDRVEVAEAFRLDPGRRAWAPLAPAAVALALMTLLADRTASTSAASTVAQRAPEQVKNSAEELRKKIAQRVAEAKKKGLKDATGLLQQVEEGAAQLAKRDDASRKEAAVKLNNLADQLDKRRQELGAKRAVEEQLNTMKDLGKGPAQKAADAMKRGDWARAREELKRLNDQIAKGDLTEEQKKQLAEQLGKMADKLNQAADAHREAMKSLERQIKEQREQGDLAKANELQQKLDQLRQQAPQMGPMQKLASQMRDAQQAMEKGDAQQAQQAMQQMQQAMEQMAQQAADAEMIEATLEQLEMAKDAMNCQQCNGAGCQACQGGQGMEFDPAQPPKMGQGMGKGRGAGPRPDEKNATSMRDTRVRQDPGRGASVYGGRVDGPNQKGEVLQTVKEALTLESTEESDPLTDERLPKSRQEHAQEFLSRLRGEL